MPFSAVYETWLYRRGEDVLAAMIGVMFVAFILQITFRYLLGLSIGSTHEVSVIMWIWIIFFGAAFVVRGEEEIRFEIVYHAVGDRVRRVMIFVSSAVLIVAFAATFMPTYEYVAFMKVEKQPIWACASIICSRSTSSSSLR